jgi:hypothetical protein
MTVASPILKQIPIPDPAVHYVPKNPTFLASKILVGGDLSISILMSSDSPVRDALLTFISVDLKITRSQGIFSPVDTTTMSPGTISFASIFYSLLFLIT